MKAEMNGVKFEGTPAEVAEVIKLVGAVEEAKMIIKWVPYTPYPQVPYMPYPWDTTVTSSSECDPFIYPRVGTGGVTYKGV